MEFTTEQESLAAALRTIGRGFYSARHSVAYNHVTLQAAPGQPAEVTAADGASWLTVRIPAETVQEGRTMLPGSLFTDYILSLPASPLRFIAEAEQPSILRIEVSPEPHPQEWARLHGQEPEPTNLQPALKGAIAASFAPDVLRQALRRVIFSAAAEDTRPVLNCILMQLENQAAVFASADGFRLSVQRSSLIEGPEETARLLLPLSAAQHLNRILPGCADPITLAWDPEGRLARFQAGSCTLTAKTMDGQFPQYDQLIPKEWQSQVMLNRSQLLREVKLGSVFAAYSDNILRVTAQADPAAQSSPTVTVQADAADYGQGQGELSVQLAGKDSRIAFNYRYLQELLNNLEVDAVVMETTQPSSPGVFRIHEDDSYTHVVMPMFVSWPEND